jgi:hypothetical protein
MYDVIYEDKERNIVIQRSSTYTPAFIALLERTVWGTSGVLYTEHGVANALDRIGEPHFLTLTVNDELVAVAVRIRKTTRVGQNVYRAFYLAALAVDRPKMARGYGKLLTEQSRLHFLREVGERGMLYSYIEAGNVRSLELNKKVGFQPLGLFHAVMFSRLRPKDDARVRRLKETERETLVQLLNDQYTDHALLDFEHSVKANDYYVLKRAGEIVAGVQTEERHWTIRRLPGAGGLILVKVLPYIPILRRLFTAGNYHFLKLGNIYARMRHEAEIFTLIEALLARQHLNYGSALMDKRSPVYKRITAAGKFGMVNAITDVPVHVLADFNGVPEEEIAEIRRRPLCFSPTDWS